MALDAKSVHKPFKRLGKLLRDFPDPPASDDVHDVRTHTRRIEAVIGAFQLDSKKAGSDLVKTLKPIRKVAGDVRDMDVLTGFAASLDPGSDGDCRLQLMHHLARRRTKAAHKLAKKVNANEKQARANLKQSRKLAESGLDTATSKHPKEKDKRRTREKAAHSMASSLQIEQELRDWPKLNESNMHPFRLKVKELRYVLQLGEDSDSKLIDALGEVKDQIGLWHDWNDLAGIAGKVLDHGAKCSIIAQIRAHTKQEFAKALNTSNALRSQYLPNDAARGGRKKGAVSELHPAVVRATSRLAS
jgi:CHAD domain-containing protein